MGNVYGFILKHLIKLEQREYRRIMNRKPLRMVLSGNIGILIIAAAIGFILTIRFQSVDGAQTPQEIQQGISNEIIRFHVLANSDTKEDQELKIKVKDAVVEFMNLKLSGIEDKEFAKVILQNQMPKIIEIAGEIIDKEGYHYNVTAHLTNQYFPTKIYGDMTFPPGEYEALRVDIGEAKGKNWWCVMFPPLCLVNGTYSIVPEESKDKLHTLLTEDEYNSLLNNKKKKIKVKVKFKLFS